MAQRSPNRILRIPSPSDGLVLNWVEKCLSGYSGSCDIRLADVDTYSFSSAEVREPSEEFSELAKLLSNGTLVTRASLDIGKSQIVFERSVTGFQSG